jgi:hypothetical protein
MEEGKKKENVIFFEDIDLLFMKKEYFYKDSKDINEGILIDRLQLLKRLFLTEVNNNINYIVCTNFIDNLNDISTTKSFKDIMLINLPNEKNRFLFFMYLMKKNNLIFYNRSVKSLQSFFVKETESWNLSKIKKLISYLIIIKKINSKIDIKDLKNGLLLINTKYDMFFLKKIKKKIISEQKRIKLKKEESFDRFFFSILKQQSEILFNRNNFFYQKNKFLDIGFKNIKQKDIYYNKHIFRKTPLENKIFNKNNNHDNSIKLKRNFNINKNLKKTITEKIIKRQVFFNGQ